MVKFDRTALRRSGMTLVEMLLVSAVIGLVVSFAPRSILNILQTVRLHFLQIELQGEGRTAIDLLGRRIRPAKADTVTLDRFSAADPEYSQIRFETLEGATVTFRQNGSLLELIEGIPPRGMTVARSVGRFTVSYPDIRSPSIIDVSLVLEKPYGREMKSVEMSIDHMQLMN